MTEESTVEPKHDLIQLYAYGWLFLAMESSLWTGHFQHSGLPTSMTCTKIKY
jgi:hypothetical protein